jgi:hypothetical protein
MHCPFIASYTVTNGAPKIGGTVSFYRTCSQHLAVYVALGVAMWGKALVEYDVQPSSISPTPCDRPFTLGESG